MGAETKTPASPPCVLSHVLGRMATLNSIIILVLPLLYCAVQYCAVLCRFEAYSEHFTADSSFWLCVAVGLLCRPQTKSTAYLFPFVFSLLFLGNQSHPAGKRAFFRNGASALVLSSAVVYGGAWMKRRGLTPPQLAGKDDSPASEP